MSNTHTLITQVPVADITLSGPTAGLINSSYTFTATVSPITATTPLTYTWEATNQTPVTQTVSNTTFKDINAQRRRAV